MASGGDAGGFFARWGSGVRCATFPANIDVAGRGEFLRAGDEGIGTKRDEGKRKRMKKGEEGSRKVEKSAFVHS